jgi:hypothetical protein
LLLPLSNLLDVDGVLAVEGEIPIWVDIERFLSTFVLILLVGCLDNIHYFGFIFSLVVELLLTALFVSNNFFEFERPFSLERDWLILSLGLIRCFIMEFFSLRSS